MQPSISGPTDDTEPVKLVLGYVPKDIAYNFSQVIDYPKIFEILLVKYTKNSNQLDVKFGLHGHILRD